VKFIYPILFGFLLFNTNISKADYGGYIIAFTIEQIDGTPRDGYTYVTSGYFNLDSIENTVYLIRAFNTLTDQTTDTIFTYYSANINYKFPGDTINPNQALYQPINPVAISKRSIKSIEIKQLIAQPYYISISSTHTLADSIWMKQKPKASYNFGGYLCGHQVYIHKISKKANLVIAKLEAMQAKVETLDIDFNNGDEIDQIFWDLISELPEKYIVIISECTC